MTDSTNHRQHLLASFGERTVSAIEGLIDDRTASALAANAAQITVLATEVRSMRERYGDQPVVREAAAAVAAAANEHNTAATTTEAVVDSRGRGYDATVYPRSDAEATSQAAEATEQAAATVNEAREALEAMVSRHEAILAIGYSGDRPPSRIDAIDYRMDRFEVRVQALEDGQRDQRVVSSTTWRGVTDALDSVADIARVFWHVGLGAIAGAIAGFVVYLLFLLGPATWDWNWAFAAPAIAGGAAAVVVAVWVRVRTDQPDERATAATNAIVSRWEQAAAERDREDARAAQEEFRRQLEQRRRRRGDTATDADADDVFGITEMFRQPDTRTSPVREEAGAR